MTRSPTIRIIVAANDPAFREKLRGLLWDEPDLQVVGEVETHEAVLAAADESSWDVLLLDLHLPRIGALSLLSRIKPRSRKILVLSTVEYEVLLLEVMRSGASGIVPKRTVDAALVQSIRKVDQGETWLDNKTQAAAMREFAALRGEPNETCQKPGLSGLDHKIFALLVQGLKNREIAERLFVCEQTVKNHLRALYKRFSVSNRLELAIRITASSHGSSTIDPSHAGHVHSTTATA